MRGWNFRLQRDALAAKLLTAICADQVSPNKFSKKLIAPDMESFKALGKIDSKSVDQPATIVVEGEDKDTLQRKDAVVKERRGWALRLQHEAHENPTFRLPDDRV